MKIKTVRNNYVSSFEFTLDLSKVQLLPEILKLYNLDRVFICVYNSRQLELKNYKDIMFDRYYEDDLIFIVDITVKNIMGFFNVLKYEFDEIVVWNCYTSFETFIKDGTTSNFLSLKKTKSVKHNPQFYLSFNRIDNDVDIICDIEISNNVSERALIDLLEHY